MLQLNKTTNINATIRVCYKINGFLVASCNFNSAKLNDLEIAALLSSEILGLGKQEH